MSVSKKTEKCSVWTTIWDKYDKEAEKIGVQFAVFEVEDTEVPKEDRYEEYLITSEKRWEQLKDRKDIVWQN